MSPFSPSRRDILLAMGNAGVGLAMGCGGSPAAGGGGAGATAPPAARLRRGMVASSQAHASAAGVGVLRAGGNAADAAVATAAVLAVTEPTSTGIGGDCFALYYDARTRAITALNGSGRAPRALTLARLAGEGFDAAHPLPARHGHTVTVPGACSGWVELAARHGTRPLAELLGPAIELAEGGYEVAPITAHFWASSEALLRAAGGGHQLLVDGRAPAAGERFRNPGLARTLRAVAAGGADAYYRGEIAAAIVAAVTAAGGVMTAADLADHAATWDEPLSIGYRGRRVWECPPNGQGITALMALGLLDGLELAGQDPLGPERWHLLIEAMRVAFADTRWYVADPRQAQVPIAELLAPAYLARRRALIDPRRATADIERGAPVGHSETVYFCTVDDAGNACSFINSNYMGFGTGIAPDGWGFTLQNRGLGFSLDPAHPNALAPGKRPYHTIIPGLLTDDAGALIGPFGVMGGFMQPQGHVQVVVGLLDDAQAPQAVLDRPRFCIDPVDGGYGGASKVYLEDGLPPATAQRLAELGHPVVPGVAGFDRSRFGRGQIILVDGDRLIGGSDRRADGVALALT